MITVIVFVSAIAIVLVFMFAHVDSPHPVVDFCTLALILLAAANYGIAGAFGLDAIAAIDPLPPSFAVMIGLSAMWQSLRQVL